MILKDFFRANLFFWLVPVSYTHLDEYKRQEYGHLALIVGSDGGPLSKREGDLSLRELRAAGYMPEALLNYLARLGHSYERASWMDPAEFAAGFAPERLGRAPARYDAAQLLHWQSEAVRHTHPERLWDWMRLAIHARVPPVSYTHLDVYKRQQCRG